jgi:hypothetical protein
MIATVRLFVVVVSLTLGTAAAADEKIPAILTAKPLATRGGDDELSQLLKARYNAALEQAHGRYKEFVAGRTTTDFLIQAAAWLRDAGLEVKDRAADRIAFLAQIGELAHSIEEINQTKYDAGQIAITQLAQARSFRLDAEIRLLRTRRDAAKPREEK